MAHDTARDARGLQSDNERRNSRIFLPTSTNGCTSMRGENKTPLWTYAILACSPVAVLERQDAVAVPMARAREP